MTVTGAVVHEGWTVRLGERMSTHWKPIWIYWLEQVNRSEGLGLACSSPLNYVSHTTIADTPPSGYWKKWDLGLAKPIGISSDSTYVFSVHPQETIEMMMGSDASHVAFLFHTPPSFWECAFFTKNCCELTCSPLVKFSSAPPFPIPTSHLITFLLFFLIVFTVCN